MGLLPPSLGICTVCDSLLNTSVDCDLRRGKKNSFAQHDNFRVNFLIFFDQTVFHQTIFCPTYTLVFWQIFFCNISFSCTWYDDYLVSTLHIHWYWMLRCHLVTRSEFRTTCYSKGPRYLEAVYIGTFQAGPGKLFPPSFGFISLHLLAVSLKLDPRRFFRFVVV
jgi:hypothetical protein